MADRNTLRRCVAILMRLPLENTTRPVVRNPLWSFLKGIEGFDNARAAECLGLLLDAQYKSISDLKHATTQELMQEAGLRPEDALEIMYAAEDAVSCVDTGFALPWACESY